MFIDSIKKTFGEMIKSLNQKPKLKKPKITKNKVIELLKKNPIKNFMQKARCVKLNTTKKQLFNKSQKYPDTQLFPVIDANKKLIGTIHEDDLFVMQVPNESLDEIGFELALDLNQKFFAKTAKDIMRKQPIFCYDFDDVLKVAHKFLQVEVNEMVVLNKNNNVVGVITQGNLLRYLSDKRRNLNNKNKKLKINNRKNKKNTQKSKLKSKKTKRKVKK